MSQNNHRAQTASDIAVGQAMEARKRLREAAGRISGAYSDACEQTILGIADLKDKTAGSAPVEWGKLVFGPLPTGNATIAANEVAQAGKQIGRAYLDAHERAALIAIELRERFAAATNNEWVKSMAGAQAGLERDVVSTCVSLARGLLI
jgi:hypothetical protein